MINTDLLSGITKEVFTSSDVLCIKILFHFFYFQESFLICLHLFSICNEEVILDRFLIQCFFSYLQHQLG